MEEKTVVFGVFHTADYEVDELVGVYSTRELAEDACDDADGDVIRELVMDAPLAEPEPYKPYVYPDEPHDAYVRLVARVGEAGAIKAVRAFQDRHGMPHGSPIGRHAEYIAALDAWPEPDPATVPTEEGKRRYPPDGLYEGDPCRCKPECEAHPCPGTCGCSACASAYGDAMDYSDDWITGSE